MQGVWGRPRLPLLLLPQGRIRLEPLPQTLPDGRSGHRPRRCSSRAALAATLPLTSLSAGCSHPAFPLPACTTPTCPFPCTLSFAPRCLAKPRPITSCNHPCAR